MTSNERSVAGPSGVPRSEMPIIVRERTRLQGLHCFSLNPNNYNNLGNLLFARQSTQDASRDGVRVQFWHSQSEGTNQSDLAVFGKFSESYTSARPKFLGRSVPSWACQYSSSMERY